MTTNMEMLITKITGYCTDCGIRKEWLGKIALLWSLLVRDGEDMQEVRQKVVKILEENFSLKIEGDSRLGNYLYYAEAVLSLGVITGIDFLYFVRNFLIEGLAINLKNVMTFREGLNGHKGYDIMEIIWCAKLAQQDVSVQLADILCVYRKVAEHNDKFKFPEVEELITSYSPLPGDKPFELRFTVRRSIEEYWDSWPENMRQHAIEQKAKILAALPADILG